MIKTKFWESKQNNVVSCNLCFRNCQIKNNEKGFCKVRVNENGILKSPFLGKFCAIAVDPIEKKPLKHWNPNTMIFSVGSFGCNMDCPFCQNYQISRDIPKFNEIKNLKYLEPEILVKEILNLGLNSVAFTYNEPTLQSEYIIENHKIFHESGISIAMVTNGSMSSEVLQKLIPCLENGALNIDLKTFNSENYKKLNGNLEIVKSNISSFFNSGIHVEITNLIVPEISDDLKDFDEMINWISSISNEIPLHITRYFPRRNYFLPMTDTKLLDKFFDIARKKLKFVYIGNKS